MFLLFLLIHLTSGAVTPFPEAMVTVQVVTEEKAPIPGATVTVAFLDPSKSTVGHLEELPAKRVTDANGEMSASGAAPQDLTVTAAAKGYYATAATDRFYGYTDGKWQPWNPTRVVVLKQVVNPIPLYVRKVDTTFPAFGQALGFDLKEGDWLEPHGRGKIADMELTIRRQSEQDDDPTLTINFAKGGNGLFTWREDRETRSELKMPRSAPESQYANSIRFERWNPLDKPRMRGRPSGASYFFRIRGKDKAEVPPDEALYGKIDGDIRFAVSGQNPATLRFTYYLNPTPGDRNLEFDVTKNLALPSVTEPIRFAP